jgi:hypothetical protein
MKPQSAKAKGRKFQQLLAKEIRSLFNLPEPDVKSTSMGASGIDIQLSDKARQVFPYAIEAKAHKKFSIFSTWKQALANAEKEDLKPLLIIKQDYEKEPLVILSLSEFLSFFKPDKIIKKDDNE